MLIAISGSQGSGKSTVLTELEKLGYNIITRKTSRSILTEWNVTLNQVNNNSELTMKFQNEIIKRKAADELEAVNAKDVFWFTERTYADLFTYALVSLGKDNAFNFWLNDYYNSCCEYCKSYSHVFYIKAGFFKPENDGVRGANIHYSRMVDLTMLDVTTQMIAPQELSIINVSDLNQRIQTILHQIT